MTSCTTLPFPGVNNVYHFLSSFLLDFSVIRLWILHQLKNFLSRHPDASGMPSSPASWRSLSRGLLIHSDSTGQGLHPRHSWHPRTSLHYHPRDSLCLPPRLEPHFRLPSFPSSWFSPSFLWSPPLFLIVTWEKVNMRYVFWRPWTCENAHAHTWLTSMSPLPSRARWAQNNPIPQPLWPAALLWKPTGSEVCFDRRLFLISALYPW